MLISQVDVEIVKTLVESGNIWVILIILFSITILPTVLRFISDTRNSSKISKGFEEYENLLKQQKEVNRFILEFINNNSKKDDLNYVQIVSILEDFLNSAKYKIKKEIRDTIQMNNLENRKYVHETVKAFTKEILIDVFDRMNWFAYKGKHTGNVLTDKWINIIVNKIEDFIYNNEYCEKHIQDKTKYYNFNIINRNIDLIFKEIINIYSKKIQSLKTEIEEKIEEYDNS